MILPALCTAALGKVLITGMTGCPEGGWGDRGGGIMSKSASTTQAQTGFRSYINGLRAWAVLAVVLYHFAIPGFSGGFSGVDVFFVISGFLMAGSVVGGLQRQRFNFVGWRALLTVHVLALGLWWTLETPDKAFYLLAPRAWELLLGGRVFLVA